MARFVIDKKIYKINMKGNFYFGDKIILSNEKSDPTFSQKWYEKGYKICNLFNQKEFELIAKEIQNFVCAISKKKFNLEKYHKLIDEEEHKKIINKTRNLFDDDFKFSTQKIIKKFEKILKVKLSDIDPLKNKKIHMVLRINRPNSYDYNPPHKDIYQQFDETGIIPNCINFWIPICGINKNSSLPVVPKSHKIPENKILRSLTGCVLNDNKYRVRGILKWDNKNELIRPKINKKQVLIFSSHLIHGCAINNQKNTTRMSLEFRLFPKL
jgi:hypothetical protein